MKDIEKVIEYREIAKRNGNPVLREKSFLLLLETIKNLKPKTILEVGTNVGLSGIAMLLTSKESKLTGIEIDFDKVKEAKENYKEFGVSDRAEIFIGDAKEIIPLISGKFDFIFLDGPKGHYYEYALDLLPLLNKGGILFADNVLFRGIVDTNEKTPRRMNTIKHSMQNFLSLISNQEKYKTTLYRMEDGVSITEKL